MKNLVVSLETAKALKAVGWTKSTVFVYEDLGHRQQLRLGAIKMNYGDCYAPTAEEVLRELPVMVRGHELLVGKVAATSEWAISHVFAAKSLQPIKKNISLSEAAAQMYIWCVEQGYIKP